MNELSDRAALAQDQLILTMMTEGYQVGAPDDVANDDGEIVDRARCTKCKGCLHYLPFQKGDSYRPFLVCKTCGNTEEF